MELRIRHDVYFHWATPRPHFAWHVGPVVLKERTSRMPLELSMTTEERVRVTAKPQTSGGHDAQLDGDVQFAPQASDCTVERIDALSAWIVSGTTPGDCVVLVSADADVGEGIETIQDTILIHQAHPRATSLGLSAEKPEPKP